ncbi:hypothetical protein AHAS_Ahas16G0240500 [Arachis hypogaea]
MGFGALRYILELNVFHKLLRELIHCFDLYHGCLDTRYGKIYITPAKIRDALDINFGDDHDSTDARYDLSQTSPTPDPQKQILVVREEIQSQPLDIVLITIAFPSSLVEEIKQQKTFISVPSKTQIEEAFVNKCPLELQYQACKETLARQSEQEAPLNVYPPESQQQACDETLARQSEQEAPLNVCLLEPEHQACEKTSARQSE